MRRLVLEPCVANAVGDGSSVKSVLLNLWQSDAKLRTVVSDVIGGTLTFEAFEKLVPDEETSNRSSPSIVVRSSAPISELRDIGHSIDPTDQAGCSE